MAASVFVSVAVAGVPRVRACVCVAMVCVCARTQIRRVGLGRWREWQGDRSVAAWPRRARRGRGPEHADRTRQSGEGSIVSRVCVHLGITPLPLYCSLLAGVVPSLS